MMPVGAPTASFSASCPTDARKGRVDVELPEVGERQTAAAHSRAADDDRPGADGHVGVDEDVEAEGCVEGGGRLVKAVDRRQPLPERPGDAEDG